MLFSWENKKADPVFPTQRYDVRNVLKSIQK